MFPTDLVSLTEYDIPKRQSHEGHSPAWKALQEAMAKHAITRYQKGSRVYVSRAEASKVLDRIERRKSRCTAAKSQSAGSTLAEDVAVLQRQMADLMRQLGIDGG